MLDDSPEKTALPVVDAFRDDRIIYHHNKENLGCCGNIDTAFSSEPMSRGAYGMVLEDDNWLAPTCLAENLNCCRDFESKVVLRNQTMVHDDFSEKPQTNLGTTRGDIFGNETRVFTAIEARAATLASQGLSNGGLFWSFEADSSFVVGPSVQFSPLQEYCRTLQLQDTFVFAPEPLAYFSLPVDESTTREPLQDRMFSRGTTEIARQLMRIHGRDLTAALSRLPLTPDMQDIAARQLFAIGTGLKVFPKQIHDWPKCQIKSLLRCLTTPAPLARYWRDNRLPNVSDVDG